MLLSPPFFQAEIASMVFDVLYINTCSEFKLTIGDVSSRGSDQ